MSTQVLKLKAGMYAIAVLFALSSCGVRRVDQPAALLAQAPGSENQAKGAPIVDYSNCATRALHAELNVNDSSNKEDLLSIWKRLSRYAKLRVKPLDAQSGRAALRIELSEGCENAACALSQGWENLQHDLIVIPGVTISCETTYEAGHETSAVPTVGTCRPAANAAAGHQVEIKQEMPRQDAGKETKQPQRQPEADSGVGVGN